MDQDREENTPNEFPAPNEPLTESLRFVVSDSMKEFLAVFNGAGLNCAKVLDRHLENAMTAGGRSDGK